MKCAFKHDNKYTIIVLFSKIKHRGFQVLDSVCCSGTLNKCHSICFTRAIEQTKLSVYNKNKRDDKSLLQCEPQSFFQILNYSFGLSNMQQIHNIPKVYVCRPCAY